MTSLAINQLSDKAELFYRRLMSVADDYGRFFSHPSILRAHCYPLKIESVSESDIKKFIAECVEAKDEDGTPLVSIYGAGKYILVHKFGQQTRSKSKFPEPSENDLLIKCLSVDTQVITGLTSAPTTNTTSTTSPTPSTEKSKAPLVEVREFLVSAGLTERDGDWFFHKCEGNGWTNGGHKIKDWKGTVRAWKVQGFFPSQKASKAQSQPIGGRF